MRFLTPTLRTYLGAVASGLLYYLSFPGVDAWPLAFFAWVPWLLTLDDASPKLAFWSGTLMGLTLGIFGFYWLVPHLKTFSGFGTPICVLLAMIVCAFQGGKFGLLGWLYRRAVLRGFGAGSSFSLAFSASEMVWPMLFPFTFAATMVRVPALLQVAEIGGEILVALTLLAANWALYRIARALVAGARTGAQLAAALRPEAAIILLGLAVPALSAVYGWARMAAIDQAVARAPKIKIGLVQANMGLAEKRTDFAEGRRRHLELTKKLKNEHKVDFVVWSETSLAGVEREAEAYANLKRSITKTLRVPTLFGAVLARPVDDAREYVLFNSALLADKRGDVVGRYDKHYLLAFGEYLPLGDTFPILYEWSPNSGRFTPGETLEPIQWEGHRIAVIICYEDIIQGFVNDLMHKKNPELIVNMTNDAWFGDTTEPWEHFALATLRAVEHRRFLVRGTNSGMSGFVDPAGRILQTSKNFEQVALAQEVAWLDIKPVFRWVGRPLFWALTLLAFARAFRRRAAQPV